MKLEFYILACSIIALALMRVHSFVNERYSGVDYYKTLAQQEEYRRKQADVHLAKIENQHLRFQQEVVAAMPELMQQDSYSARNIASVISDQSVDLKIDSTKKQVEQAKEYFMAGNYLSAMEILKPLEVSAAGSTYGPEIHFLLMESYHKSGDYKKASEYIERMLQFYPESDLSGYAILRLGDYFKLENDKEMAEYCYHYALENFYFNQEVAQEAERRLGAL
tara:strand:- start:3617 stop:4282 length:666 start_codon:yes stop_codon:yes gene_type:complete